MIESIRTPDGIGYHRYEGFDLKTKHEWVKDGNSGGANAVADSLKRISDRLQQSESPGRSSRRCVPVVWLW